MRTSYNYIHEMDIIDDFYEYSESLIKSIGNDIDEYYKSKSEYELKSFFENTDIIMEKEGIVTKLGNAIISLIKKIKECISKFVDKIFHKSKKIESDVDKVNKIVAQHPELRDTIVKGIKEEWFTYRDVAAYEKDIVQLMLMLEKEQISHQKFKEKVGKKLDSFINGGQKIIAVGATVAGILLIAPKIITATKKSKESGKSILSVLKSNTKKAKVKQESVNDNDNQVQIQKALIEEGARAYNIINKYNNHQFDNLEKIVNATLATAGVPSENK